MVSIFDLLNKDQYPTNPLNPLYPLYPFLLIASYKWRLFILALLEKNLLENIQKALLIHLNEWCYILL